MEGHYIYPMLCYPPSLKGNLIKMTDLWCRRFRCSPSIPQDTERHGEV